MVTVAYLFFWLVAFLAALAIALATHYSHAYYTAYPDKLFDEGKFYSDKLLNELFSPNHRVTAEYEDDGWWKFNSWRNYAIHALPNVLIVLATGLLNWPDRAAAVAWVCAKAADFAISPRICQFVGF